MRQRCVGILQAAKVPNTPTRAAYVAVLPSCPHMATPNISTPVPASTYVATALTAKPKLALRRWCQSSKTLKHSPSASAGASRLTV